MIQKPLSREGLEIKGTWTTTESKDAEVLSESFTYLQRIKSEKASWTH
jgi:hypothetical protein